MPQAKFVAITLLALLVLALPDKALAGPPERVSGKMVLDEVVDGLRKYRKEKDPERRATCPKKLASERDSRMTVAAGGKP